MPLMSSFHEETEDAEKELEALSANASNREILVGFWYNIRTLRREVRELKEKELLDLRKEAEKHNGRLSKVERFMWMVLGVSLAVGTMASIIAIDLGTGK